ncbi:L,D-transpeptidase [Pseudooceanicola sp. LIPI14-2-Ac024]|uniref:L,D-transpeptidase n=1 Tax=Pseudooceanicola sp. LIPI14-2-Ac024 TaxID=3344875 RepID=UPI0035D13323
MTLSPLRALALCLGVGSLAACGAPTEDIDTLPAELSVYGAMEDDDITLPPVEPMYLAEPNHRAAVLYTGPEEPGTIVVDPYAKFLYYVDAPGSATRYPIAVGREGRGFSGRATIQRKEHWPGWTPTANMLRTEPEVYGPFAGGIPGGVASPLGARALYLYRGGNDTRFRIHGTNDMASIGNSSTAGCIRLFNQDIIDLFDKAPMGTEVVVRTYDESIAQEGIEMANRGVELPPTIVDPEVVYAAVEAEKARRAAE